ncbi:maleylpyruvate isomerase N-terminal domain-containing protein [Streptomyces profundus]|uniref:maleylpyruvate isomerase N-terminal domain-containing protein n=1 Tax=Streptomyces profundus TaxID=2867410 RepID=UPI001D160A48|nr:maleylpyruvate isomerase N-terminal domain-containing protein [Streptomyces sp. MA3_2.13]UED84866.1 maleylpyruvate isomerase N-terminal domain-containing protein [Streptomyces sp. MA3_2.13]
MSLCHPYLDAAEAATALLAAPEVAAAWEGPSVLAEMTVHGLAGHLAHQVFSVDRAVRSTAGAGHRPVPVLEHYARAAWVDAPVDSEVNAGIRANGERVAAEGAAELVARLRSALAEQRVALASPRGEEPVELPWGDWTLNLDDFLLTRMVELAVHMDDLAVSVGVETPALPPAAFDPVAALLAGLAARRHGQPALLRALTRAERAPSAINAF